MIFEDATTRESSGTIKTLTVKTYQVQVVGQQEQRYYYIQMAPMLILVCKTKDILQLTATVTTYTTSAGEQILQMQLQTQ